MYIDDYFVEKGGEIGILLSSLFSNHAHVIMVVGKKPYHNNSFGHISKWIYLDKSFRQYILQMWKLQSAPSINVLQNS